MQIFILFVKENAQAAAAAKKTEKIVMARRAVGLGDSSLRLRTLSRYLTLCLCLSVCPVVLRCCYHL